MTQRAAAARRTPQPCCSWAAMTIRLACSAPGPSGATVSARAAPNTAAATSAVAAATSNVLSRRRMLRGRNTARDDQVRKSRSSCTHEAAITRSCSTMASDSALHEWRAVRREQSGLGAGAVLCAARACRSCAAL